MKILWRSLVPVSLCSRIYLSEIKQGKKFFIEKNYQNAVKAFNLALINDSSQAVNYTNLALALKNLHRYQQSIATINKMCTMQQKFSHQDLYIVKGLIIKARCQTILAKNQCIDQSILKNCHIQKADKLIRQAISSLQLLIKSERYGKIAKQLNVQQYLQNSIKIKQILNPFKYKQSQQKLQKYLKDRVNHQSSMQKLKSPQINQYFKTPAQVLSYIQQIQNNQKKQQLLNNPDESQLPQYVIDKICYEIFKNPILVKSGLTYQDDCLRRHYQKNGSYDPITREHYTQELGIRNNTLMAYINQTFRSNGINQLKLLQL